MHAIDNQRTDMALANPLLRPLRRRVVYKVRRGVQVVRPDTLGCVLLVRVERPVVEVVLVTQRELVVERFWVEKVSKELRS